MKISVVIVSYNVRYFLEVCLHSVLRAAKGINAEIFVVDNNSSDDSVDMIRSKFPEVMLIENRDNKGFSKANNQAVALSTGEYVLFLNPDTVMPEDFFQKTINYLDHHPEAGSLGPRLIDGKGKFAPDSKKSFPSLSVAIFKTTGINNIFPRSPYFNKYYAVHVDEHETAAVEGLSGCCMMVRKKLIDEFGGAFDEDYFMYCEDVDLAYRIQQAGYQNVYFPEAELIHYKGESTRKASLSYVRVFNDALITFVKKHYGKSRANVFVLFIKVGIVLRAILSGVKLIFRVFRLPMFDAVILLLTLWFMKEFWVNEVKNILPIRMQYLYATLPVYTFLWVFSLYLNGAYDQPYRALRVVRGMFVGTIFILAYYGLLQVELRYSRAIIILSGFIGTVLLLGLHEILYRFGIVRLVPHDALPKKAVIVADEQHFRETATTLRKVQYAPELIGRVSVGEDEVYALAPLSELKSLLYTAGVNEVIFCINGMSYVQMFQQMQICGSSYDYKIHLPGSRSFVGSNSSHTAGDLYTTVSRYNLSNFAQQRNKRVFDVMSSSLLLVFFLLSVFFIKKPVRFLGNCVSVLTGRKTWVGYPKEMSAEGLPKIKPSVIPAYFITGYTPSRHTLDKLFADYAMKYTPGTDFLLLIKNFRYLGGI